jgi:hypothetical protein
MMQQTFLRRLVYYLIGFGMGMILVLFFFQNRGCSWLPKNKVKETVLKKIILVQNPSWNITSMESFLSNYDIDFSQSSKDSNEKTYFFTVKEGVKTDKPQFYISFWPDSYMAVMHQNKNELKKTNSDVYYKIAHVPSDKNSLVNFDEARSLQKKLVAIGLDATHYTKTLKTKGCTLYNHSKPNSSQVFIQLMDKKDTIKITYEWKEFVLYPLRVN